MNVAVQIPISLHASILRCVESTYILVSDLRWNYVAVLELLVPDVVSGALELGVGQRQSHCPSRGLRVLARDPSTQKCGLIVLVAFTVLVGLAIVAYDKHKRLSLRRSRPSSLVENVSTRVRVTGQGRIGA
jgi:hypothetical protein